MGATGDAVGRAPIIAGLPPSAIPGLSRVGCGAVADLSVAGPCADLGVSDRLGVALRPRPGEASRRAERFSSGLPGASGAVGRAAIVGGTGTPSPTRLTSRIMYPTPTALLLDTRSERYPYRSGIKSFHRRYNNSHKVPTSPNWQALRCDNIAAGRQGALQTPNGPYRDAR